MTLIPSTPSSSPPVRRGAQDLLPLDSLLPRAKPVLVDWLEPQDRAGRLCLALFSAAGVQASIALLMSAGLIPFHQGAWNLYATVSHALSPWLWALPVVFGLASVKRLANTVAWFTLGAVVLNAGWDWLPFGGQSLILKTGFIAAALLAVIPTVLRPFWRSFPRAR